MRRLAAIPAAGWRWAVLALMLALAGCFTTSSPLITLKNADFPFKKLVLISEGKEISLLRGDKGYIGYEAGKPEAEAVSYLIRELGRDLYLVEVSQISETGAYEGLMGIVRRQGARLTVLAPTCSDASPEDLAAAGITRKPAKTLFPECDITSLAQMEILARRLENKPSKDMVMTIKMITK